MLTSLDLLRLTKFMMNHPYVGKVKNLENKLQSLKVVESNHAPEDLVTMNSEVHIYDMTKGESMKVKLVYQLAPFNGNQASVLSPLGSTLLGMKVLETCEYELRDGTTREIRVLDILYQPERNGHYDL